MGYRGALPFLSGTVGKICRLLSAHWHLSSSSRFATKHLVCTRDLRLMYIELHARSAFSFLEGASVPEELISVCAASNMSAMGLLDRDGVYGSPRFHLAAKKVSMRAHVGAEVISAAGWRYLLLVESREGYQNLCRLITRMKLRARKSEGC